MDEDRPNLFPRSLIPEPDTPEEGFRPACFDPTQTDFGYPGHDTPPVFDQELEPLTEPQEEPQESTEAEHQGTIGKGPSAGFRERWRSIARYNALGFTNKRIGELLGYSPPGVSLALKHPWVQAEVEKFRAQFHDPAIMNALKSAGPDAIQQIHKTILDDTEKSELRSTNSRWVVEKLTGKAKQEVSLESNTLATFLDTLKQMQQSGESLEEIDVTPQKPEEAPAQLESSKFSRVVDDLDLE